MSSQMSSPPDSTRAPQRQSSQIFISYSRSDRLAVDQLFEDLRRRHYTLWMDVDEHGIEPGEKWEQELMRQVSASEAIIACISPDFLRSKFCRAEIEQALREHKPVFPVLVRRLDPDQSLADIGLDELQYVDLTQGYDIGLKRMMNVLPRPKLQLNVLWERFGWLFAGIAGLLALLLVVVVGSAIGGVIRATPAPPTALPLPTSTPTVQGDLKVVVTQFELDELNETEQRLADNIVTQMSKDLEEQLKAQPFDSQLDIGILTSDVMPRVLGTASAQTLASAGDYHIVIYGRVVHNSDGSLEIAPRFYIPADQFTDAPEMTGDQEFGSPIVLESTDAPTAYQTSAALQSRVQALVYVIQGIAEYTARNYTAALSLFNRAASLPNWEMQREVLNVLRGNVYLQRARDAIAECERLTILRQLKRAEDEYQQALLTDDEGRAYFARPYAAMAEVAMLQASWSIPNKTDRCTPVEFDLDKIAESLRYSEMALDAYDFFSAVDVIRAQALFTRARAQMSEWIVTDPADTHYGELARQVARSAGDVISLYQVNRSNETLKRTAFEAYLLRGVLDMNMNGSCEDAAESDLQAAVNLRGVVPLRRMFGWDFLGQCYERNDQLDDAIDAYTEAYRIAETLERDVNRNVYGCLLIELTEDEDAAEVTEPCQTVLQ
jgi:tetratricopeptide (TPR) repeat protein